MSKFSICRNSLHEILSIERKNVTIKFNEILSMDDISYEILSHGHYFIEDNILWYTISISTSTKVVGASAPSRLPRLRHPCGIHLTVLLVYNLKKVIWAYYCWFVVLNIVKNTLYTEPKTPRNEHFSVISENGRWKWEKVGDTREWRKCCEQWYNCWRTRRWILTVSENWFRCGGYIFFCL